MAGEGWQYTRVEEMIRRGLLAINDGYRVRNIELGPVGIPFVRGGDIGDGGINTVVEDHIRPEFTHRVQSKLTRPFDVAFITKGTVGRVGMVRPGQPPSVFAPQVCYWRSLDPDQLEPRFLFYLLTSDEFQSNLDAVKTHGSMVADYVSMTDQRDFRLSFPPIQVQKAIAAVLGALDDKIELNRRMNATLEAMARALFQSWFVDFDPVRAKLDNRHPTGMDAETAALFPDSFQESEAGHIPTGWSACLLPDAVHVNPQRVLKKGAIAPYLDMKNLPTEGHSAEEVIRREFGSGTKFINGDTLLARITPCLENGKTGFVDFLDDGEVGWGSTEYIVLRPKPPLSPHFGYLLARSDTLRSHAIQNMTGSSGRQRVPSECFNTFYVAVPTAEVARRFGELTAPLMAKIKSNSDESRTLAILRDTLLPKLLSGELSVARAAQIMEHA